jgi:reactive chlorine resistance protein C
MMSKADVRGDEGRDALEVVGGGLLRYGVVFFLLWFGLFKFTAAEAKAIEPLVSNNPLMSWMYGVWSLQTVSNLIGVSELTLAALIASRPFAPALSALGSVGGIGVFLVTLSFLVFTPGVWAVVEGFPVPTATGGFLVKDVFLLGACVWSAGEARDAMKARRSERRVSGTERSASHA